MKISVVIQKREKEIVKSKEMLKTLFDFYRAKLPSGIWVINTTPHDIGFGREVIKRGPELVVNIFGAYQKYEKVKMKNGLEFVRVADYVPYFEEWKDNILEALEELDIYALGSVITINAFKSCRVVGIYKEGIRLRNGFFLSTFVVGEEVSV